MAIVIEHSLHPDKCKDHGISLTLQAFPPSLLQNSMLNIDTQVSPLSPD